MTNEEKKKAIRVLVAEMLQHSQEFMLEKLDKVMDSGAIDIDKWDENNAKMVLPKTIAAALLQRESVQYEGRRTGFEKQIKKDIKNISYFL